jgi:curved DNA-binding protein CbpA
VDIKKALEVLEVNEYMEFDAIRRSYRDLAEVWHPDRYAHNQRLAQKANEKLKEINNAYHIIQEHFRTKSANQENHSTEQKSYIYVKCVNCGVANRLPDSKSNDSNTKCGNCGQNLYAESEGMQANNTTKKGGQANDQDIPEQKEKNNNRRVVIIVILVLAGYLAGDYMVDNPHQTVQIIKSILSYF